MVQTQIMPFEKTMQKKDHFWLNQKWIKQWDSCSRNVVKTKDAMDKALNFDHGIENMYWNCIRTRMPREDMDNSRKSGASTKKSTTKQRK